MTVQVLKLKSEILSSRIEMQRRGIDYIKKLTLFQRILKKLNLIKIVPVGDYNKSWDVLKTVNFLESGVKRSDPILDIGAYGSEILCSLSKLNYTNLIGIDLNSQVFNMPFADNVKYICGDFLKTQFEKESFSAVTAISVIEHGFDLQKLFQKLSYIIKLNGYFIASVDFWPTKINTDGIKAYGLDWVIFAQEEILSLIKVSEICGFEPVNALDLVAQERTTNWNDKSYTFAWFVLRKIRNLPSQFGLESKIPEASTDRAVLFKNNIQHLTEVMI